MLHENLPPIEMIETGLIPLMDLDLRRDFKLAICGVMQPDFWRLQDPLVALGERLIRDIDKLEEKGVNITARCYFTGTKEHNLDFNQFLGTSKSVWDQFIMINLP